MSSLPQSVEVPSASPSSGDPEPLRIVLFGLPAAGKSSLLGALSQAAETQPALLKGGLIDRSQRLSDLRQRVYFTNQPTRTVEEVVPYPVEYRPLPEPGEPVEAVPALLIDCDGQVAIDLLRRRKSLNELSGERALAKAVLEADALLLIIDTSAPVKQMETDFEEFSQFLTQMELSRGARTEVGGLPVFLVLTKCDLLSRPDLPRSQWRKQIEERQRYVGERFQTFIRRRKSEQERRTFGRIDLYQAATATNQPAFADAGAKPLEPYGVGPLFQQALEKARQYRQRRRAARRRLTWTIGLAGVVLGVLLTLLAWLLLSPQNPFTPDTRTAAQRLAGTPQQLRERLNALIDLRDGPEFGNLHSRRREEVTAQIQELQDYLAYYQKVFDIGWPGVIESEEQLGKVRNHLREEMQPRPEWAKTSAAQLHAEYLSDAQILVEKADVARKWFQRTSDRLRDLWTFRGYAPPINWRTYQVASEEELAQASAPPFQEKEPLRQGLGELTWSNVLRIDTVKQAQESAQQYNRQLRQVLRVAAALGLVALGQDSPAVLEIPRGVSMEDVIARVGQLRQHYPNYRKELVIADLPEAMRPEVLQAADTNYLYLLGPGRAEILRQLRERGGDTRDGWRAVRQWLTSPKEMAEWRTLVGALNALRLPPPADPVPELEAFLEKGSFTLNLSAVEVRLPLSLELAPRPDSALEIYQPRVVGTKPVLTLKLEPEATRKDLAANQLVLLFRTQAGPIAVQPGDDVYGMLELAGGRTLTWRSGERSRQYPFERLRLPPRLEGRREDGVKLRVLEPANGMPTVPELLPEVPAR